MAENERSEHESGVAKRHTDLRTNGHYTKVAEGEHFFTTHGTWVGSHDGVGEWHLHQDAIRLRIQVAQDLGGPAPATLSKPKASRVRAPREAEPYGAEAEATHPEELLLAAAGSCLALSLGLVLTKMHIPLRRIEMVAEGTVVRDPSGGFRLASVHLRPTLVVRPGDAPDTNRLGHALALAEGRSVIAKTLRAGLQYSADPIGILEE